MKRFAKKMSAFLKAVWSELTEVESELLLFLLASIIAVGVVFYNFVEGWGLIDSLYFSVMTLTTVGYGDFVPKTDLGKLFTVGYIIVGIVVILGFLNNLVKQTVERHPLNKLFKEQKFYDEMKKYKE